VIKNKLTGKVYKDEAERDADINDSNTSNLIAYASITGPTICNIAKGPIILEENDVLTLETSDTTSVTAVCSILEISREDQNG